MSPNSKFKYEMVQDEDDINLQVWERQLRVSKFMIDNKVQDTIQKLLKPVYESTQILVDEVEARIDGPVENLTERIFLLEQAVFGQKGPTNRF